MRTPVFTAAALLLISVFTTSCQKSKFSCVCAQQAEGSEVRQYDISAPNRRNAVTDCRTYEVKLATESDLYTCQLDSGL
ncbi:MAG: hypothetical protein EOP51_05285 [Sphingobacteriales bacterium]|nr:MAG: hypothetical protein EOP51_05285 [Sphingobacteriales bacterium]